MTEQEYLSLWKLNHLHRQAVRKYEATGLEWRERVIKKVSPKSAFYNLVNNELNRHAVLNYEDWYEKWYKQVLGCLDTLRENAGDYSFKFVNVSLGNWTDTTANRFEKQIKLLGTISKNTMKKLGIPNLWRVHYDDKAKTLLLLLGKEPHLRVKKIRFAGKPLAHDIFMAIFKLPKDSHDLYDILEKFDFVLAENYIAGDRKIYDEIQNINKKIKKEAQAPDFLIYKGGSVQLNDDYL